MDIIQHPEVAEVFNRYPPPVRRKLLRLRQLILDTAAQTDGILRLEETLKWGEPSYLVKGGSTIRLGWTASRPDQYGLYFNCKSRLVDTFRELYPDTFQFAGNRAIVFGSDDRIPVAETRHCITLSLTYHRIKHLPMLGA